MKRLLVAIAAATGIVAFLICAWFGWELFGPSVITIRNVGDHPARLVLTDADQSTEMWSGELAPGRRRTVMVWFRHEGSPELRCRDQASRQTAPLGYVTSHMPMRGEVRIDGCDNIQPHVR